MNGVQRRMNKTSDRSSIYAGIIYKDANKKSFSPAYSDSPTRTHIHIFSTLYSFLTLNIKYANALVMTYFLFSFYNGSFWCWK